MVDEFDMNAFNPDANVGFDTLVFSPAPGSLPALGAPGMAALLTGLLGIGLVALRSKQRRARRR